MRFSYLIIALILTGSVKGQFAIISDKDGYTNVRKDGAKGSNVVDSLPNGHLVYCFENKGNWTNIDYQKGTERFNGYIYGDRYKVISTYLSIPVQTKATSSVKLVKDSIEITITQGKFDKTKHTFRYYKEAKDQIQLIDGKMYWGTDGGLPKTEYQTITVTLGKKKFTLPKRSTENLFEPSLYSAEAYYDQETKTLYIQTMNSDGAGSYEVVWKIKDGVYKERLVAYGF